MEGGRRRSRFFADSKRRTSFSSAGPWRPKVPMVSYLSKMYFIEDNLIRMSNTPEPCDESQCCDYSESHLVVPFRSDARRDLCLEFWYEIGIG